ncbi:hypothetical protein CR164_11710 [Prosthecochloris marina]|uniref:O-antigen ligase-related domain-containing protein n=1 Tax=Prosthecochloris marina TaxID=2017681 RepID=A0A317T362_9CHLB|nr:O-antigen ligase family protein [Prosthecochloris marina]PWW81199.1 hypothetical protein CR164_11710 [Prosthecochloris marina]
MNLMVKNNNNDDNIIDVIIITIIFVVITGRWLLARFEVGTYVSSFLIFLSIGLLFKNKIKITKEFAFYLALLVILLLINVINVTLNYSYPIHAIKASFRYLAYFVLFIACYNANIRGDLFYRLFTILLYIQIPFVLYEAYVIGESRPHGLLGNGNHLSYLIVVYCIISLVYYKNYFNTALFVLLLLFLKGIGSNITLAMVFGYYVLMINKGNKRIVAIIIYLALMMVGLYVLGERLNQWPTYYELYDRYYGDQYGGSDSLTWRLIVWKISLQHFFQTNGVLFGLGIDFTSAMSPYSTSVIHNDPHNEYVRFLIEHGVLGFLYFILLIKYFKKGIQKIEEDKLRYTIGLIIVAILISAIFGNVLVQANMIYMVICWFSCKYREYKNNM